jgi:hypothetical protein
MEDSQGLDKFHVNLDEQNTLFLGEVLKFQEQLTIVHIELEP